ncbi:hypothetical protein ACTFR8_22115 [Bacillus cereus group sp. MYBK15-3]|uniref:hypothetical protein n=1 Tax=unclassified Bacillus cereus group TaxID=2750818 RepID=UPI003F793728
MIELVVKKCEVKEAAIREVKRLIEDEYKFTDSEIVVVVNKKWMGAHGLGEVFRSKWLDSVPMMFEDLYPNRFKPWEFKSLPSRFWTKELGLAALKWVIEDKLELSDKALLEFYSRKFITDNRLTTPCLNFWGGDIFGMLRDLYPNRFNDSDFLCMSCGYWTKSASIRFFRWLVLDDKGYTKDEILNTYNWDWVKEVRLDTAAIEIWDRNLEKMFSDAFPEWVTGSEPLRRPQWLVRLPEGYWTKERVFKMLGEIVQAEGLSREDIVKVWSVSWLVSKGLKSPLSNIWGGSPARLLEDWKPGEYRVWELSHVPIRFWKKETAIVAVKWAIEEKHKLTGSQILGLREDWMASNGLAAPFNRIWKGSFQNMIHEIYPGRFKPWEFRRVPVGYWTEETSLEALRWVIEEKHSLTREELMKVYGMGFLRDNKLIVACRQVWGGNSFKMVEALYPHQFFEWEFKKTSVGFWTKENIIKYLRWLVLDKNKYTKEQFMDVCGWKWLQSTKVNAKIAGVWENGIGEMVREVFPEWVDS